MKFTTICLIVTTFIDASVCVSRLGNANKCLFKSSIQLSSQPCNPNLFSIKQNFHIGTPSGKPLRLTTCNKIVQEPAPLHQLQHCQQQQQYWEEEHCPHQQQQSSTCQVYDCVCNNQPSCKVGCDCIPLEEKPVNLKLGILVPKGCSVV